MSQEPEVESREEEPPKPAESETKEEHSLSRPPLILPHIPDFVYRREQRQNRHS
jgi:hypothetical protein